jgi:hypothetical protein
VATQGRTGGTPDETWLGLFAGAVYALEPRIRERVSAARPRRELRPSLVAALFRRPGGLRVACMGLGRPHRIL